MNLSASSSQDGVSAWKQWVHGLSSHVGFALYDSESLSELEANTAAENAPSAQLTLLEELTHTVKRINNVLRGPTVTSTLTEDSVHDAFCTPANTLSTFLVANELFEPSSHLVDTYVDVIEWLDNSIPVKTRIMFEAYVKADNSQEDIIVFPFQGMRSTQNRALMAFGSKDLDWPIIEATIEANSTCAPGHRQGKITIYNAVGALLPLLGQWIITMLTLAKKRNRGPLAGVS